MATARLSTCDGPLAAAYDVALLDLDGVVYVGADAVPGAAAALAAARMAGIRIAYVTNNASRTPAAVAAHLGELGVEADAGDIVTSAQAAARLLAERLVPGAAVLVVGGPGLREAVTAAGLRVVSTADEAPRAVVQGYTADTTYGMLAEAALAVRGGALWIATNADVTMPSPRGPLPGNGALVAAVAAATGRRPEVAGKPEPALHRESVLRTHARRPLVVGDRLDTDIRGAVRAGSDSLLVLTGVTTAMDLLRADPEERPSYVATGLGALLRPAAAVEVTETAAMVAAVTGSWRATCSEKVLTLDLPVRSASPNGGRTGSEADEAGADDALRALCATAWTAIDAGRHIDGVTAAGAAAAGALSRLGLAAG